MRPRTRASLLWGVVGGLSFLVLLQGYRLLAGVSVSPGVTAWAAVLVTVGATALTYWLEGWGGRKEQS